MRHQDAAKILNISGDINADIVKAAYRKACSIFHPDRNPAGAEMMKAVNEAYEVLKGYEGKIEKDSSQNYGEDLIEALNAIVALQGLVIEVCGAWVWVTGNTKEHKDIIKAAGYKWSKKKAAWYFRPESEKKRYYRGNQSLDDIRATYGSKQVRNNRKAIKAA